MVSWLFLFFWMIMFIFEVFLLVGYDVVCKVELIVRLIGVIVDVIGVLIELVCVLFIELLVMYIGFGGCSVVDGVLLLLLVIVVILIVGCIDE